jgi:hypothetical protein
MTHNFRNPPPFMGHAPTEGRGLVFLVAIRRNFISPVSHQSDLLQRMGVMLMTPDEAAVYPLGRTVGPLPSVPAPEPPTSLTARDRRFLPRPVHGEILRDTNGTLYEKIGQSVRPIRNLAIGPKGEIVEFAASPRAGAISSTPHVRPPTDESDKARREGWSESDYEQKLTAEYAPPPMAPQRPTARPTRTPFRMFFPNPGQWRIVQWRDFKDMLAPQLAHPERLNDPHQIPCYVQVYETPAMQPLAALARAVLGESGTANDFRPLSAAIATKLQLELPPAIRSRDPGPAPRKPGLLPPHERVFRLQVALDPTIDMDPDKPLQSSAPEQTPTPVPGRKSTIPDHFLNPLEFKISRDEATYEMNIAPGLEGSWLSLLRRIKHRVSDLAFRKWKALLCGKELEEQLWAVSPPKHGLTHPVIREWALQTLQTAGYDTSVMLAEWELFWRRKGL